MVSVQRPSHDFDAIYASEKPPAWDIGRPQAAFDRLAKAGDLIGSVLDPGCGTGEHALLAVHLATKWWESTSRRRPLSWP